MLAALGCTFHHVGVACRDLDAEAGPWLSIGYAAEGVDFEDQIQQVRGRFLVGVGPRLRTLGWSRTLLSCSSRTSAGLQILPSGLRDASLRGEPRGIARRSMQGHRGSDTGRRLWRAPDRLSHDAEYEFDRAD